MAQRKPKQRTLHGEDHQAGRYRQETVEPVERPRLKAKVFEFCIARQMARLEATEHR